MLARQRTSFNAGIDSLEQSLRRVLRGDQLASVVAQVESARAGGNAAYAAAIARCQFP